MALIDGMREKFTLASQTTVQKAKDLSEITKLNSTISSAEDQISDLYGQIGYEVYRSYHATPIPEVAKLMEQVTLLHQKIADCKEQIANINKQHTCPNCGGKINKDMAFCSECGYKITQDKPDSSQSVIYCCDCGAQNSAESLFCARCGHKLK